MKFHEHRFINSAVYQSDAIGLVAFNKNLVIDSRLVEFIDTTEIQVWNNNIVLT